MLSCVDATLFSWAVVSVPCRAAITVSRWPTEPGDITELPPLRSLHHSERYRCQPEYSTDHMQKYIKKVEI